MTDFVGGAGDLESFWRGIKPTDHRLSAARTGDYTRELIPLLLHGDGVHVGGTYSNSNYNNASMEGLLTTHASGGSMERCYLLAGYLVVELVLSSVNAYNVDDHDAYVYMRTCMYTCSNT